MARTRDEIAFAAKRVEILDAAEALFAEHGFHQTGMAAICSAVGMSPGALYRYFRSKVDIIRAIVERERLESLRGLEGLADAEDFGRALARLLAESIEAGMDGTYGRLALEIAAEGHRDATIGALLQEAEDDIVSRLASALADAKRRGAVDSSTDAEITARLLVALVDGAMSAGPSFATLPRRRLRATLRRLTDAMLGRAGGSGRAVATDT